MSSSLNAFYEEFPQNSFAGALTKTHSVLSSIGHVFCCALFKLSTAVQRTGFIPVWIGGSALSSLSLTLFARISINIVMLLIALSETTATTKITALTTVAFTVCHYINYHNGYDRLCLGIHTSTSFMSFKLKRKTRGDINLSIFVPPCASLLFWKNKN